ncbi:hypothetical protein [Pseudomonas sp. R26(2017)]|uniref:hypothetical protein n=1 Tax=unclassified Pseudomonas TaxID=196821 RepID=UPI003530BDAB
MLRRFYGAHQTEPGTAPPPEEAAALLKWSGVDIMQVATRLSEAGLEDDAQKLMKIALSFQEAEDKLTGYTGEVKAGRITREGR